MNRDLNINHGELKKLGINVKALSDDFDALLKEITSANETLKRAWQGTDAESYSTKVSEQSVTMNQLRVVIDELGDEMIRIAEIYLNVMEGNIAQ